MKQTSILLTGDEVDDLMAGVDGLVDEDRRKPSDPERQRLFRLWAKLALANQRLSGLRLSTWGLPQWAMPLIFAALVPPRKPAPAPAKTAKTKTPRPTAAAGTVRVVATPAQAAAVRRREIARKGGLARAAKAAAQRTAAASPSA